MYIFRKAACNLDLRLVLAFRRIDVPEKMGFVKVSWPGSKSSTVRFIDLTQVVGPSAPQTPFPKFASTVVSEHDRTGTYARIVTLNEHLGTHVDAPCHFAKGQPLSTKYRYLSLSARPWYFISKIKRRPILNTALIWMTSASGRKETGRSRKMCLSWYPPDGPNGGRLKIKQIHEHRRKRKRAFSGNRK